MRRVPRGSSATSPASLSSRRCRDTAGRLIGSASAISRTDRPPPASNSTMARRWGSPSADRAAPALGSCAGTPLPRGGVLDPLLEPLGELVERGLQVRHGPPDEGQQRAGVLL